MKKTYALNTHLNNIKLLENWCEAADKTLDEKRLFNLINVLADFIEGNQYYNGINYFEEITGKLVNVIELCNSEDYTLERLYYLKKNLQEKVFKFIQELIQTYPIYVYFAGKDKYKLIPKILKNNIKFEDKYKKNSDIEGKRAFNILLRSEETVSKLQEVSQFDHVIEYDRLMNDLFDKSEEIYYQNYDYNYLHNAIKRAKEPSTDTIIVGHSYSLYGIESDKISQGCVNLSLSSQDLYYSYKIAKDIIDSNPNVEKCYIGTGYWSFNFDLSRAVNNEGLRIDRVYYPIYQDEHHHNVTEDSHINELGDFYGIIEQKLFDLPLIYGLFSKLIYDRNKGYFHENLTREDYNCSGIHKVEELSQEHKDEIGEQRANLHNKLLKYTDTKNEYEDILMQFVAYLNDKNVEAILVNFPQSSYYNKTLNQAFKEGYYNILNNIKRDNQLEVIDLMGNPLFKDEDFIDMDHVNSMGALKITNILNLNLF